jgi:hypothetical protein
MLTLLNPLEQSGFQKATAGLAVVASGRYLAEQLRLSLVLLQAWGVLRLAHVNDEPVASWGVPLGTSRRPDGDTLDHYLKAIVDQDEAEAGQTTVAARLGQVRPGGLIDQAQQASLRYWAEAGLLESNVWYFDGHTVQYSGQAAIGKTKHGTKRLSVPAIDQYTLANGVVTLTDYFPTSVPYTSALRQMVGKANAALPPAYRIRQLAFDKEGWEVALLKWVAEEADIALVTWVKNTSVNQQLLAAIPNEDFVPLPATMTLGKVQQSQVLQLADTQVTFPDLGVQRVLVLETDQPSRVGIYTTAAAPKETTLADERSLTTIGLLETMRLKQRIENRFKVEVHQMAGDAIPTHQTYTVTQTVPYDLDQAQRQCRQAQKRLDTYDQQSQQQRQLHDQGQLDKHEFNLLNRRTQRLRQKAQQQVADLTDQLATVTLNQNGQPCLSQTVEVLDLRKLTLLSLFKSHALVALAILVRQLGLEGAGPQRLRRQFLAHGDRVVFDPQQQIATVYAKPFPRRATREAYEQLCALLQDVPITLERDGVVYRVRFSC